MDEDEDEDEGWVTLDRVRVGTMGRYLSLMPWVLPFWGTTGRYSGVKATT